MRNRCWLFASASVLLSFATLSAQSPVAQTPTQKTPMTTWPSQDWPDCSTEIVNGNCTVTINRPYPITMPTIQVRPGKQVAVVVANPLSYETLSLDAQTAQALLASDQVAALANSLFPNLKGGGLTTSVRLHALLQSDQFALIEIQGQGTEVKSKISTEQEKQIIADLDRLQAMVDDPITQINKYEQNLAHIDAELQEVMSPMPRHLDERPAELKDTPNPWRAVTFGEWQKWVLNELAGWSCTNCPLYSDVIGKGRKILAMLNDKKDAKTTDDFFGKDYVALNSKLDSDINTLPESRRKMYADMHTSIQEEADAFFSSSPGYYTAITQSQSDLQSYVVSIAAIKPLNPPDPTAIPSKVDQPLGIIYDPVNDSDSPLKILSKILGRQVTFAVNAVNRIVPANTVTAVQKKSVATVTVLYADPKFEPSAGVIFSTLVNRSFANQTIVTQNTGAVPTQGNVVVDQTITRPTIEPFAAANYRINNNFAWPDNRRGAFYVTTAVGLNPNSTTVEFGIGPSLSWRSLMISPLAHFGRDVRLTQGEYIGQVWCNQTAAVGTTPKCSGSPPAPSTERYWTTRFAIGVSVRIPTAFSTSK